MRDKTALPVQTICPVCNGSGVWKETIVDSPSSTTTYSRICYGCYGEGWIDVDDTK